MKKLILLTLISALPLGMMAQDDDMYFVPTKENVAKEAASYGMPRNTYYSGSDRSVDEYNRRAWSTVAPIDSAGNDIIDFSAVRGVYPDSAYTEVNDNDYQLTRRMSRFDDYTPSQAYWDGYRDGRWSSPWHYSSWYSWYDPWYYDSWYYWRNPWYYSSWYGGWYDPWYGYGWYSPWRYGYRGYYYGYRHGWYGGSRYYRGASGRSWSRAGVSHHKNLSGVRSSSRSTNHNSLGGYRSSTYSNPSRSTYSTPNTSLGGTRSSGWSGGGGSFGGSRSSGGGGGRSVGGGHSYGGRR